MSKIFCNFAAQNVWSRDIEEKNIKNNNTKWKKTTI